MVSRRLNVDTLTRSLAALAIVVSLAACQELGRLDPAADRPAQAVKKGTEGARSAVEKETKHVNDTLVTTKVKTALFEDPEASGFQITVNTYRGVVQLSGFVDTTAQKQRAGELAERRQGVRAVHNDLLSSQ